MHENYITAVLEQIQSGVDPDVVLSGLGKTLERRGHTQLYEAVLRGVMRVLEAQSSVDVSVTVAKESDYSKFKDSITNALTELQSSGEPTVVVDDTIIGGFIAEANDARIDNSYKSKLVTLYRSLIK